MLNDTIAEFDAPGAAIAIKFTDGSVFQHSVGVANTTSGELLETGDYFRIGSVTKTFTAVATLLLFQDGLLSLDDTVESILPDLTEFIPMHGKGITVRMLLNQTSGLADYVTLPENDRFITAFINNPEQIWRSQDLVARTVEHSLLSTPGAEFHYSNTNYILLGLMIEKLSSTNYEAFIANRLLQPLEMQHTSVPLGVGFPGKYAHGYYEKIDDAKLFDYSLQSPTAVWSAGNIISTLPDVLIWLESLMRGGLLQSEIKSEQFDFPVNDEGYGYGLGVASIKHALGHNGSVLGYQTQMFEYQGVYFVIYTNCYYETKDNVSNIIFERAQNIIFPQ